MSDTITWIRVLPGLFAAATGVGAATAWQRRAQAGVLRARDAGGPASPVALSGVLRARDAGGPASPVALSGVLRARDAGRPASPVALSGVLRARDAGRPASPVAQSPFAVQAIGAATWAASVALKVAWAIPMNPRVHQTLRDLFGLRVGEPLYWLYVGVLTGVFEVGATIAVICFTRRRHAPTDAITFGVGFGATEAVVLGVLAILPVVLMRIAPAAVPPEAREAITRKLGGPIDLPALVLPALERASALVFHVVPCALVAHGFRVGRGGSSSRGTAMRGAWFAVAFVYKSGIDAYAAWAILSLGVGSSSTKLAWFDASLGALAIASGWALRHHVRANAPRRVTLAAATPSGA